ncbi:MAG: hypothetical protein AB8F95_09395 [Bacteroidia bacterium]
MAISSRVHIILDSLTDLEEKQIVPWLTIMYDHRMPYLAPLCKALLEGMSSEDAWQYAFPSQPYSQAKFHRRCFNLADAMEYFLVRQELENSPDIVDRLLLQAYSSRGKFDLLERTQAKMYDAVSHDPENENSKDKGLLTEKLRLAHDVATARQAILTAKGKITITEGISDMNITFDNWWLHEKLYLSAISLYYQPGVENPTLPYLTREALTKAETSISTDITDPSTSNLALRYLYHLINDLLLPPKNEEKDQITIPTMLKWLQHLGSHYEKLPLSLMNFFYLLIGVCINRSGTTADPKLRYFYLNQIWELHMWGIKTKVILSKGKLPWGTFTSLLSTAFRLDNYAKELNMDGGLYHENLDRLIRLLPQDGRTDALLIGKALLFFHSKDYSQTLKKLSVSFENPLYELMAKSYSCLAMYEQEAQKKNPNFEDLRSFAILLRRSSERAKGITETFRLRMKNFCLYYDKLCKDYRRDRLPGLGQRIHKTPMTSHREWLLKKVRERLKAKEEKAKK